MHESFMYTLFVHNNISMPIVVFTWTICPCHFIVPLEILHFNHESKHIQNNAQSNFRQRYVSLFFYGACHCQGNVSFIEVFKISEKVTYRMKHRLKR